MEFHVEALLLDIDGTLVDSTPAVQRTWRSWAASYGFDAERILEVSHGRRTEDMIAELLPADRAAEACRMLDELELADMAGVVALPGVRRLLRALGTGRWAVVTSGGERLMRARLAAAGLPAPEVFISAGDVSRGKPDPQGYLMAAARLGVDPGRVLVIEDAPAGVRAGQGAGAAVLAVATTHQAGELSSADCVVEDLRRVQVLPECGGFTVRIEPPAAS